MTRALHELIQSPEGMLLICAAVLTGLVVGILMMVALDVAERLLQARLKRGAGKALKGVKG
jgi:hypothetical protein